MKQKFSQFISDVIDRSEYGVPVMNNEIVELLVREFNIDEKIAKKVVNTNLNRMNGKIIQRYRKGIYYKPEITLFGKAPLSPSKVVLKMYLKDGNQVIGYETGASLLQQMGLTTQIPKYRFIATNRILRNETKIDENLKVVLRKPHARVTADNMLYLQLIDAVENEDKVRIDAKNPYLILNDYIEKNNLDFGKLVAIAEKDYGKKALIRIVDLEMKIKL